MLTFGTQIPRCEKGQATQRPTGRGTEAELPGDSQQLYKKAVLEADPLAPC